MGGSLPLDVVCLHGMLAHKVRVGMRDAVTTSFSPLASGYSWDGQLELGSAEGGRPREIRYACEPEYKRYRTKVVRISVRR